MATEGRPDAKEEPARSSSPRDAFSAAAGGGSLSGDTFGKALGMEVGLPSEVRRVLQAKLSLRSVPADAEIRLAAPPEAPRG